MDRALGVLHAALRRRMRSPGARLFVGAVVLGLAIAILLPSEGAAGAAVVLESALVVIGVGAGLAAASSAGSLPEDRGSGVHAWLAATACPKAVLRAAPAVAGVVVTVVTAVVGAALVALLLSLSNQDVATRRTTPLDVTESRPSLTDPRLTYVDGLSGPNASTIPVELEVRPHYRDPEAVDVATVELRGTSATSPLPRTGALGRDDDGTRLTVPARGRVDVALPAGPRLSLRALSATVDLSILSARRIDGPASFFANVLRAGLLIGLALASIAPIAVLLSRFLSTSSAVTAALVLAGVGVLHGPLLALAADAQGVAGASIASAILHGATWLAPDLSAVAGASEALVGHVLTPDAFAPLRSPALHAAAALLLLSFVPARRIDA